MFKSILLVFVVLFSCFAHASAFVLTSLQVITEVGSLHYGGITADAGSSCNIDSSSKLSGPCNASDPNISIGQIVISDLARNTDYEVSVTGSSNAELEFIATAEVSGGKAGKVVMTDGQVVTVTTKGNAADLTIQVYGQITLLNDVATGQDYQVDYNVVINAL